MGSELIETIRSAHREHRYILKSISQVDRRIEAYIRVNVYGFTPFLEERERTEISKKAMRLIKACRDGEAGEEHADLALLVAANDESRRPLDKIEAATRRKLERLAQHLPGYSWVKGVRGAGALGFAQIIGEAGDLAGYATPAKLWSRLGLAPYDGLAMSTWRRESWRPRALTAEEWTDHPFKPERYALMIQIATWLRNAQWVGAAKTDDGVGRPDGPYGEVYAQRRAHTAQTHPDWTPMHSDRDALRFMVKRYLKNLRTAWKLDLGEVEAEAAE